MGNMSGMFSFAFWVIMALKCEAVRFIKFESAGVHQSIQIHICAHFNYSMCTMHMCMMHMPNVTSPGLHMMQTTSP